MRSPKAPREKPRGSARHFLLINFFYLLVILQFCYFFAHLCIRFHYIILLRAAFGKSAQRCQFSAKRANF